MTWRLLPGLLAAVLLLSVGSRARAGDESPKPPRAQRATVAVVRDFIAARGKAAEKLAADLRRRGPKAAGALRAALKDAKGTAKERLALLLGRIERDWHRKNTPEGMVYVAAGYVEVPRTQAPWGPSGKRKWIDAFYIDRTEVTVAAWREWLEQLKASTNASKRMRDLLVPPAGIDGKLPVTRIRWDEARRYAEEARGGRLPVAAEFERTLRGSGLATWPWGNEIGKGRANLRELGPGKPLPVGTYPKGVGFFGALDLVGNVAEWSATHVSQGTRGRYPLLLGGSYIDAPSTALTWRGLDRMRARVGARERRPWIGFRVVKGVPALP